LRVSGVTDGDHHDDHDHDEHVDDGYHDRHGDL
jgi:hypothetical protein